MACPFTVVVFASGLKDVGDVRRLEGRSIEIHGAVKLYDGRAEIILNRISQITGGAAMIPPLPKNYDVENRGHYSAGTPAPHQETSEDQGQAEHDRDLWQRCGGRRPAVGIYSSALGHI